MRILFVCTALASHGGIQRFNRNLVQALSELGAELDIVIVADAQNQGVSPQPSGVRTFGANGSKLRWGIMVLRLLISRRYDRYICGHLHLAGPFASLLRIFGARRAGRFLILHGIEVWNRVHGSKRRSAQRYGRVLAVSTYTARSFLDQMGTFPANSVSVFPNTINPDAPIFQSRAKIIDRGVPCRLLSVSRLTQSERDKGILDVLSAIALLRPQVSLRYVIVGDGNDRIFLEARACELNLSDCVEFTGSLSDADLWRTYANSDVFVLPSRKEGFGIVFLEAMRFGLPVIGAREKGALDVVRQDVNGMLVDYGDAAGIARALLDLASDPDLRVRLGAAGKALVEPGGEFSFDAFRVRCQRWIMAA